MNMQEIERALRELRLSGIAATLSTRVMQAQSTQEPFLDTFAAMLQDELDRRRSRLTERRFKQSRLDERLTLADFDWRFNPKLPRQACFELHTLKFIGEGGNALIIGKPGTGKSHVAKAVAYQATLQGFDVRYVEADTEFAALRAGQHRRAGRAAARLRRARPASCWTICSWPGASPRPAPSCCRPSCTSATSCAAASSSPPTASCRTGASTSATPPWPPPSWIASCTARAMLEFEGKSYRLKEAASRIALNAAESPEPPPWPPQPRSQGPPGRHPSIEPRQLAPAVDKPPAHRTSLWTAPAGSVACPPLPGRCLRPDALRLPEQPIEKGDQNTSRWPPPRTKPTGD